MAEKMTPLRDVARAKAINYLEEYSGLLWKEGQHDRSVDVGTVAAVLADPAWVSHERKES